jgi:large subunit ribosomal protein L29
MKSKQLNSLSVDELKKKLLELRKEMIKHNSQVAAGASVKSPALIRNTKRTIARIIQVIENKEK